MRRAWVGVDLGTQSVRALAVAEDGRGLGLTSRPLHSRRPGEGRHEQDVTDWWECAADALAELCAALPGDVAVGGVAVDATSGTLAVLEPDGTPSGPGVMYDDTRGAEHVAAAQEAGAALWDRQALRVQGSWALPTLVELARTGRLGAGRRVVHQGDVVAERLVGHPVATDANQALKTGVDLTDLTWPTAVLAALGVDAAVLPAVVLPGTPLGTVSRHAAARTGLAEGTPVLAGTTDGCAAQLGSGALAVGEWNCVLGTTLVVKGVSETVLRDPTGALYSHRSPEPGRWLPGGASSTGAGVLTELLPGADLDALTTAAAGLDPVGPCYPLAGRGERFPFVAPGARAFGVPDGPPDRVLAAVAHGVAHVERLAFDLLDLAGADVSGPVVLTGGGARNRWWNQLRADVLGVPARVPEAGETALGAAVLAASATTGLRGAAAALVRVRETLDPAPTPRLHDAHLELVAELAERGWVPRDLAEHASRRSRP